MGLHVHHTTEQGDTHATQGFAHRRARRGGHRAARRPGTRTQRRAARSADRSDARGAARDRARLQGPEDRAHRPMRRRVQARHEQPLYPRAGRRARGSQRQGRHRRDPLLPVRAAAEGAVRRRRDLGQARAGHLRTLVRPAEPVRHLSQLDPRVGGRRPTRSIATARPRPVASGTSASSTTRAACSRSRT